MIGRLTAAVGIAREDGFTIVEMLVAMTILIVGVSSTFMVLDASRRLTLAAERQTSTAHRAQLELERLKSLPYSQLALTGTSSQWSTNSSDYAYVGASGGSCPGSPSGSAPTYQPDHSGASSATEPLVINGCSYTSTFNGGSTTTTPSTGSVAPVQSWSAPLANQGSVSGNTYDFITWTSDPSCSQSSGTFCPASNDYKRLTVVVTTTGTSQPSHPAIVSSIVADPNATPPQAPNNSNQNPIDNPSTSCTNASGQTVSCSNTMDGTPLQYFLTDTPSNSSYSAPSCSGNALHNTWGGSSSPDLLVVDVPTGSCTDSSGNPIPPCFATGAPGCQTGIGGLPIVPTSTSIGAACGTPPSNNTQIHAWATPQIASGTTVNLTGAGGMTAYLESTTSTAANATLCFALYSSSGSPSKIGSTQSINVTASAATPNPVTFNFNVGASATLANPQSIEIVLWIASAPSNVSLVYDQSGVNSQVSLVTA